MSTRIHSPTVVALAVAGLMLALTAGPVNADTIYVDDDAGLGGDGLSWHTPFKYLQDALFAAGADPSIVEIRVGQGTYKPDQGESGNVTPGDAQETFQLISGVALCGGYAGMEEPDPDLRDIELYETVLSGDIGTAEHHHDNSYHVVTGSGTDQTAVLDGFTIASGNGSYPSYHGGGMYNINGSPTVLNCVFHANQAFGYGGGMYNSGGSPVVVNCVFSGNLALEGAGGGMFNSGGSPMVIDCIFAHNDSWAAHYYGHGGGMANERAGPTVVNCLFIDNWVNGTGAAVECHFEDGQGPAVMVNCTISGNSAEWGHAVAAFVPFVLTNCIVWDNVVYEDQVWGEVTITYSCIEGGWPGEGNIDADPLFIDPDGPDDNPNTWEDNDYRLSAGSPCIDAADNDAVPADQSDLDGDGDTKEPVPFDLDGFARFVDDPDTDDTGNGTPPIVDMGVYEYQIPGDLNHDGCVDQVDLGILLGDWGCTGGDCPGDCNGDGNTDQIDLGILLAYWGEGCP